MMEIASIGRPFRLGLLLALGTLLLYLPVTTSQFISYDDGDYVTRNDMVQRGLTWEGVKWAFEGAHASNWHPLTWLSHMADCDLFRLNPAGPHLVNSLIHALNAALLFALFVRLTGKTWPSALTAALFAWHPLHVESVAWVSERKDVLSTFFALLTLLSYARYIQGKKVGSYWLAVFLFMLALLSKPMPVTLPLVMFLLDFWPLQRLKAGASAWALVCEKIPFILLSGGVCIVTILAQNHAESSLAKIPFVYRLENAATAYVGYLSKTIWPVNLGIFYQLNLPVSWRSLAGAVILLAGISALVWLERRRCPWLWVGWLWFLITLLPVIGLVQVGAQSMADRYSYFPSVGLFLGLAFSLQALVERITPAKKWVATGAILILGTCVGLTENQIRYWHDNEALFRHALAVEDSYLGRIGLGAALNDENRTSEALHQYIMAARLAPAMPMIYNDIGRLLDGEGHTEKAAVYYQKAVKYGPETPGYHEDLGMVLVRLGHLEEGMREFSAAAQADPKAAPPHFVMGRLLLNQGRDAEAVPELRRAVQLDPNNAENLFFVASVLASDTDPKARNGPDACVYAQKAVELTHGQQPAALDVLAMAYAETGRFDDAALVEQQVIKMAEAAGQADDLVMLQKRLSCYQAHQPWREVFH